jgi:hypothetical protein
MNELRNKAIARQTRELREGATQLERISRHQPRVSRLVGEARRNLAAAEVQAEPGADCTLTACDEEELHRRAANGDVDALAEWCRREVVLTAA